VTSPSPADSHVENRLGEPAANLIFYMAANIAAGLDGIRRELRPSAPVEADPYAAEAPMLPTSLSEAVTGLVQELRDGSPEFARLWERHDVQAAPMLTKTFRHPVVGEITVDCDSLALTDRDQHLVLYSAPPGSHGAEALALLNVLGTENINASGTF
jgi:hypothetical protein